MLRVGWLMGKRMGGVTVTERWTEGVMSMRINELELSVRAHNCLMNDNIVLIQDLVRLSREELLKMPNMGKKSVDIIKSALGQCGLRLGMNDEALADIDESSIALRVEQLQSFLDVMNRLRDDGVEGIRALVQMTRSELVGVCDIGEKEYEIVETGLGRWNLRLGVRVATIPEVGCESATTVKDELLYVVNHLLLSKHESWAKCFIARHGVDGAAGFTLEHIGSRATEYGFAHNVTRERVRQVTERAGNELRGRSQNVSFRLWEPAVRGAREGAPMSLPSFLSSFGYESARRPRDQYDMLARLAAIFGLEFPFQKLEIHGEIIVVDWDDAETSRIVVELGRALGRTYSELDNVAQRVNCGEEALRKIVAVHPGFEFLDGSDRYIWKKPRLPPSNYRVTGNTILTCLCKIFSIAKEARVLDLAQSLPRDRSVCGQIPCEVLAGVADRSGLFDVRDGRIRRKMEFAWTSAGERDAMLMRVCVEHGQTVTSRILYSALVRYGLTSSNAHILVAQSPFLVHTAAGVGHMEGIYKFVVCPDDIDLDRLDECAIVDVEQDDCEIFLSIPVSPRVLMTGRYLVDERVGLDGKWEVRNGDGGPLGNIVISGKRIEGLSRIVGALRLTGGDELTLERGDDNGVLMVAR